MPIAKRQLRIEAIERLKKMPPTQATNSAYINALIGPIEFRTDLMESQDMTDALIDLLIDDKCKMYWFGDIETTDGQEYDIRECSECGLQFPYLMNHSINYCPNCGRKVKR